MSADNVVRFPSHAGDRPGAPVPPAGPGPAPEGLPAGLRQAAERLARRLASEGPADPETATTWDEGLELETAWQVAAEVRRGLATGSADAHMRLDAELMRIVLRERDALIRHHRSLLVDVSHDLRSPLNSILFLADAIRSEHSGALLPQQRRQISVVYTAAVTLVRLVNDLIDFARLGNGAQIEVSRVSFSVESVLADVEGLLGPLVAHRNVRLETHLETDGPRTGDPHILNRVLLNLVSNAVDAVEAGGRVAVEIGGDRATLRAWVVDDRVGTDVEELRRRLSFPSREGREAARGWTRGLGLAICARLVSAAGGSLAVEALPDEGTAFRLELPFAAV